MTALELAGLFVLMAVQVVVPPLPAELIVIAAGSEYGLWTTTVVAGTGLFAGGLVVYRFGTWIERRFGGIFARDRVRRVMVRLERIGSWLLLVRVLPYNPSDTISYVAGILRLPIGRYVLITGLVSYVRCGLLAYFGTRISDARSLLLILSLLAVSALVGGAVAYGGRRRD